MTFKRPTPAGWAALAIAALCVAGFVDTAFADDAAPAAAAAAAPVANKGDVAWMLTSSALVLMMSIPGLALFYGGLVRTKNMASVLTQVFAIVSLIGVTWTIYGYSLAFGDGGSMTPWIGGFGKAFMHGIDANSTSATFSNGVVIPELVYFVFQMTFAMITPALIVGAFAERIKFSAVMLFILLWSTFIYYPIAHWVWYVAAPDDIAAAAKALAAATTAAAKTAAQAKLDEVTGNVGWLAGAGALDFAGGTVVHINSGIAALVCALMLGRRNGYGRVHMAPHSVMMTAIGTGMLWMGWFGFNAGSALEATGAAGMAFFNTLFGTAVAGVAWTLTEWIVKGKPSLLGVCSGIVAGLVAITPAAGYVGPVGAFVTCAIAGVVCFYAVTKVKALLGYDDALDTFGVHCIGGIIGSLGTGTFVNPAFGGTGVYDYVANKVGAFDAMAQIVSQLWDIGITLVWSGLVAFVILWILKVTIGIRSSDEDQEMGLDLADHGEKAYNFA